MKKNKKKLLVMITHSLGELDVLCPLFTGVKKKYDVDVEIIFVVNKIYQQFETNDFYRFCVKELDIKITSCQLPNKFDYRDSILVTNALGRLLIKYYFKMLLLIKFPLIFLKLFLADAYMHETSNQRSSTFLLHRAAGILGKTIFTYHHGHSLNQMRDHPRKIYQAEESVFLLFHELNKDWANSLGYTKQYVIGFTKFYSEWISLLNKYNRENFQDHIVIFSRQENHPYYMDSDKYKSLIIESYESIRKYYRDNMIVIKPHPREDITLINNIIDKEKMKNIQISWCHSGILSKNAILAISFWTSAVFDSLSLNIPTIEFYKEATNFRQAEPKGSLYKLHGIESVETKEDLIKMIERIKTKNYQFPPIINELSLTKDLSFIAVS